MEWKNKKGYTTFMLVTFIFVAIGLLIALGVMSYGFGLADDSISAIEFNLGNTSFSQTYNDTLKPGIVAMETTVPVLISTAVLLGMVFVMMIVSYNLKKVSRLWILLDIGLIIVAEVLAVSISDNFRVFINSSPEMLAIFTNTLSAGSKFVLNLPIIVPIVGALVMLATYLTTEEKEEESREFQ